MGGLGSGTWFRLSRKDTVEESLTIAASSFRRRLFLDSAGTFTWRWSDGRHVSVHYKVGFRGETPVVKFEYRCRDGEVQLPVLMQCTPLRFGGQRWWFTCPLIVNGVACERRVAKLYSPPRSRYFGCRVCQRLTYRSCQEAHSEGRRFGTFEGMLEYLDALKRRDGIE